MRPNLALFFLNDDSVDDVLPLRRGKPNARTAFLATRKSLTTDRSLQGLRSTHTFCQVSNKY